MFIGKKDTFLMLILSHNSYLCICKELQMQRKHHSVNTDDQ